jgi:hypothetical protein
MLPVQFIEVDHIHGEILRKKEEQDRERAERHLFCFNHMGMWTKLRPGIWNFLEKVCYLGYLSNDHKHLSTVELNIVLFGTYAVGK